MVNKILTFTGIGILSLMMVGCSTAKNVKVKSYFEDRARVDQNISGNQGYMAGQGTQESGKPTRRVFVVEVSKENSQQNTGDNGSSSAVSSTASTESVSSEMQAQPQVTLPKIEDEETQSSHSASGYTEYVVEKDDTLQKVSKKFYGSYGKWTKIYEANKSVIKNPDFLKPGTKLMIPTGI